jgi:hypothetical protein
MQTMPKNQAGTFNNQLVDPGNLPRSPPPRTATHRACLRHRMVALAARTSGRCSNIAPQAEITTVNANLARRTAAVCWQPRRLVRRSLIYPHPCKATIVI